MDKKTSVDEELVTDEIQNWYAYQGPLGEVVCNDQSFFAWKDGCPIGASKTLEEAMEFLGGRRGQNTT
jgi:hypothetical protein